MKNINAKPGSAWEKWALAGKQAVLDGTDNLEQAALDYAETIAEQFAGNENAKSAAYRAFKEGTKA